MKRPVLTVILLALVVLVGSSSCSKSKKREKITDPVQQQALRTRDKDIPIDSLFTASAAKEVASPFKKIAIRKLFADFKVSWASSAETATREKYAKDLEKTEKLKEEDAKKKAAKAEPEALADYKANFTERLTVAFRDIPAEGYSPSLTVYFLVVLLAFVVIFTVKVIKTFFISPK